MTAAERALWQRVQRRAAQLTPDLKAAVLRAFADVRHEMTGAAIERAVLLGRADQIAERLVAETVAAAIRETVRDAMRAGYRGAVQRDLPPPARARLLTVGFDILHPNVRAAVQTLETRVMQRLASDARETVRAAVDAGLRDGLNPRTIARGLRDVIGLGPSQWREVANYGDRLRRGLSTTQYQLRDRRLDRAGRRDALSDEQVARAVDRYRVRRIAWNAETVARSATVDALKAGQRLSWDDAIASGVVEGDRMVKTWVGVMDDRERPEHVAMEGETVGIDEPFSNGQQIPGESDYNCRCVAHYALGR